MSEKDNGNTTETTPPPAIDPTTLERLKRDSFWHKMARGYLPKSYYYNAHCPGAEERIAKGELIGCVLKGVLSNTLQWVWRKGLIFCLVTSAILFILFSGLYSYHAFMPIVRAEIQAMVAAFNGLTATVTVTVAWLGLAGTVLSAVFLAVGIFSLCVILGGLPGGRDDYHGPDFIMAAWTMWAILTVTDATIYVARAATELATAASLTFLGENVHGKLATPYRWLRKKLDAPVIIE